MHKQAVSINFGKCCFADDNKFVFFHVSFFLSFFRQLPQFFNPKLVLSQLRYSGMLETVRIRRAGYPVRRTYEDFLFRYIVIVHDFKKIVSAYYINPSIVKQISNKNIANGKSPIS